MNDFSLDDQIAEVKREIGMRERVYGHQVGAGKMTPQGAERKMACMRAVLGTLKQLKEQNEPRLL